MSLGHRGHEEKQQLVVSSHATTSVGRYKAIPGRSAVSSLKPKPTAAPISDYSPLELAASDVTNSFPDTFELQISYYAELSNKFFYAKCAIN